MVSADQQPDAFSTEVVTELIKVNITAYLSDLFILQKKESVSAVIGESQYSVSQVEGWSKTIAETISVSVQKLEHAGFKYIINVMLVQKTDGGIQVVTKPIINMRNIFQSASTCYWDMENDRQVQIRWENKFMNVFVHLYALKSEY